MEDRPCAVCKAEYANPGRDLCQGCFQEWASGGRDFCARCKAPKEINSYDLCSSCYCIWKIEVEEFEIQKSIDAINAVDESNASSLGDVGRWVIHKKSTYVPNARFRSLYEEYKDLCGVFLVGYTLGAGQEIRDPVGDALARMPLWHDVPPEQMGTSECSFCLGALSQGHPVKLAGCTHCFHDECAKQLLMNRTSISCPICSAVTGLITGNQPPGIMKIDIILTKSVDGAPPEEGTIYVTYSIPSGIQGPKHKSPGTVFEGTTRSSIFPDTPEGRSVVRMIRTAFKRRLVLTIGQSASRGKDNVVVWGEIPHKSRFGGGEEKFGYPDPGYLGKVRSILASLGISDN